MLSTKGYEMASQQYRLSPLMVLTSISSHWELIHQLTRREIASRYRGSLLGMLWSLAHPIVMLMVYTFVFRVVFKASWSREGESSSEFAVILFTGLIVCAVFNECVNRAPTLILNHASYVKKIVFPLEILPWVSLGGALFHMGVSLTVLLVFHISSRLPLNWTAAILPLLVIPLALYALGVSWFLASVGVFVRDVGHATTVLTNLMLFLAPVFYPLSSLPDVYHPFMYLNPLTFVVEQSRNVLIMGGVPSWHWVIVYFLCSTVVAWLGLAWFQHTRKGFADVL